MDRQRLAEFIPLRVTRSMMHYGLAAIMLFTKANRILLQF